MKTIKQIIIDHLESIGAEGLCDPKNQCGCDIKDLFTCEHCGCGDCVPAMRYVITQEDMEDELLNLCDPEIGDTVYFTMKDGK